MLAYTSGISALGLALFVWSLTRLPEALPGWLLFLALIIIAELTSSEAIVPQMLFSISSAVAFATLLLFGPLAVALAYMIGGLVITMVADRLEKRPSRAPLAQRLLFNMSARGLSIGAAGAVYLLLGGSVGGVALVSNLLPILLAALTSEFANAALVIGAVSLQTGQPALEVFRQNVSWALPIDILVMVVGGPGLAIGYEIAGPLALGVFFMPLALTIYAFRVYVTRTRAQVEELERNVEERRRAEEELRVSLDEKEVLLKEIHHRVKNNLQVISALLYLQGKKVEDGRARTMFAESENRIRSMSLVHELLYQSTDLAEIDFHEYVESLAGYLLRSYRVGSANITLDIDVEDVNMDISTAIPCGLILNELLSNAFKYAFPDGAAGRILVQMKTQGPNYRLLVQDNGIGMPEGTNPETSESLGLQLVSGLANQLGGKLEPVADLGTGWTILFPNRDGAEVVR